MYFINFSCSYYVIQVGSSSSALSPFATPLTSILKVFLQTAGELDSQVILFDTPLLHPITSYALIIVFIIAVPILFNNFLVRNLTAINCSVCRINNILVSDWYGSWRNRRRTKKSHLHINKSKGHQPPHPTCYDKVITTFNL